MIHKKKLQNRKLFARGAAISLTVIIVLTVFPSALYTLYAMFDESEAVHINPEEIENSTLAIGTHLIYLGALDDEIYSLASQTAEDSGQTEMYYKSELGDGAWYAISSAGSLEDITKKGSKIDNQIMKNLFFTYHTRSDGITYDLRTNEAVNPYDIINPYDLDILPELEDLKNQMQTLKSSGTDISLLEDFFDTKGEDEENEKGIESQKTKLFDGQMEALYQYKLRLIASGASSDKLEMVKKAMDKVDAARRYEANSILTSRLNTLMNQVSESSTLSAHSDLMAAIGDCLKEVQNSMDEQDGNRLYAGAGGTRGNADAGSGSEGTSGNGSGQESGGTGSSDSGGSEEDDKSSADTSALSLVEQDLVQELLSEIQAGNDEGAGLSLDEMASLYDITDGTSRNTEREKALLDGRLIPKAKQAYEETGSAAAKNELEYYEKLRAQMDGIPEDNKELNSLYDEKQNLQEQRLDALDKDDQTQAKRLEVLISDVDNKIQSLEANGIYGDGSASQSIQDMKDEVLKMLQDIIDKMKEESDIEDKASGGSEGSTTEIENGDGTESSTGSIDLASLDAERIGENLDGIGTLCGSNPDMASGALKEIYQKLQALQAMAGETDAECEKLLTKAEEIMAENLPVIHGTMDAAAIAEILEEVEGASLESSNYQVQTEENKIGDVEGSTGESDGDNSENSVGEGSDGGNAEEADGMDGEDTGKVAGGDSGAENGKSTQEASELAAENAAALVGIAMFCEQADAKADSPVKTLLAAKAKMLSSQAGGYVFQNLTARPGSNYAPVDKIAGFCSYRYVWKENQKKAILAQGGKYYEFKAFSDEVKQTNGEKSNLESPALFQSVIYLPADYVEQEFSCQVYDLSDTGYSVLLDTAIADTASEVCDAILKKGGE